MDPEPKGFDFLFLAAPSVVASTAVMVTPLLFCSLRSPGLSSVASSVRSPPRSPLLLDCLWKEKGQKSRQKGSLRTCATGDGVAHLPSCWAAHGVLSYVFPRGLQRLVPFMSPPGLLLEARHCCLLPHFLLMFLLLKDHRCFRMPPRIRGILNLVIRVVVLLVQCRFEPGNVSCTNISCLSSL